MKADMRACFNDDVDGMKAGMKVCFKADKTRVLMVVLMI